MNERDDLKAYLDGELPPLRMAEMRDALDADPSLAREAASMGSIGEDLRSAAWRPEATGFEATLARLDKGAPRVRDWGWVRLPAALAALATLAFVIFPMRRVATNESPSYDAFRTRPSESKAAATVGRIAPAAPFSKDVAEPDSRRRKSPPVVADANASPPTAALEVPQIERGAAKAMRAPAAPRGRIAEIQDRPRPAASERANEMQVESIAKVDATNPRSAAIRHPVAAQDKEMGSAPVAPRTTVPTWVIEVDSTEAAEGALRDFVARREGVLVPPSALKATATPGEARQVVRRLDLEIPVGQVDETRRLLVKAIRTPQGQAQPQAAFGLSGGSQSAQMRDSSRQGDNREQSKAQDTKAFDRSPGNAGGMAAPAPSTVSGGRSSKPNVPRQRVRVVLRLRRAEPGKIRP